MPAFRDPIAFPPLAPTVAAMPDVLSLQPIAWRGVPAWRVVARRLTCVVTATGGHLAALTARGDDLNPFWQPPWPATDPATVPDGGAYGPAPEARLLAGIVGHNQCCDRFGAPWPGETKPLHGESGVARWSVSQPHARLVEWRAWLPEAKLRLTKRIAIDGDAVQLVHAVEHDDPAGRDVEWCEHVNIGGPMLDDGVFAAGADRATQWPQPMDDGRYRDLAPEADVPVARALAFPAPDAPPCGDMACARVRDPWWLIANRRLARRLVYRWRRDDYPWIALWTQHRSRTGAPWNGRARVRGMEMSTKPWPEGKPPESRATTYQGRPTTCTVPPGRERAHEMEILWERI